MELIDKFYGKLHAQKAGSNCNLLIKEGKTDKVSFVSSNLGLPEVQNGLSVY